MTTQRRVVMQTQVSQEAAISIGLCSAVLLRYINQNRMFSLTLPAATLEVNSIEQKKVFT